MPRTEANGIEINYDETGDGETVVLVHGGWSDRNNWFPVVPVLAESFRVVAYDRRGHGFSQRDTPGTRRDQEDDLAGLVESLGGRAHVVGTSFGGSIAIGLASRRPDLVTSVVIHEPPLVSVAADDPDAQLQLAAVDATIHEVTSLVGRGDTQDAARLFVEEVALGPGAWDMLPPPMREVMIDGAAAFVAEQLDPDWASIDLGELANIASPALITDGDSSPPWFRPITQKLAEALPGAETHTYEGAGHAPHLTHPQDYLAVVGEFLSQISMREATPIAVS